AAHYQRAYPHLAAVAAGVLGKREGAEDIVQEAAGIAVAKGKRFDNAGALAAWLIGVVRRCAQNERRKSQRRRTYAADPVVMATQPLPPPGELSPVDSATGRLIEGQSSFEDRLQHALLELTEEARCCLLLRTVHELDYTEIADLLTIPRGTAMSHVHRSRQKLRRLLAEGQPDTETKPSVNSCQQDERP
ncbi:MAG: RNA polymerase sigma factor, partial [Planctomycetales bacterium]|nr:RNA polymerase sigma factor [Planctomycetales bacterium]